MFNKKFAAMIILCTLLLTACSTGISTFSPTPVGQVSLQTKLGAGLLTLEGTSQAVTAEQASALLPFWQAYKSLSGSSTSSQSEIQALYRQIQETLTSEQLAAIQQAEFAQETLSTLMKQYNVQANQTVRRQSQSSSTQSSAAQPNMVDMGGGMPAGDMAAGGMPAGDMGSAADSQTGATTTTTTTTQPVATSTTLDLNTLFADAVLQVLTLRVQA